MNQPRIIEVERSRFKPAEHGYGGLFTAQCGEDQWLADNWPKLGLPDVGFFVDFGAADGKTFSNTYWLEKAKGWRGLLIEPNPDQTIKDRPNSIIERVAVGPADTITLELTADPDLARSLPSQPNTEPRLKSRGFVEVESVRLTTLLERHNIDRVDLMSVDTEGTEIEAWRTLDLNRWRPRVVIVEYSTWHLRDDFEGIKSVWEADGYELLETTTYNCIFRDSEAG